MSTITPAAASDAAPPEPSSWKATLAPYARPHVGRSLLDLLTSVVPYVLLFAAMYLALDVSYLLTLALSVPAAGFLLRTYIVFHDCAHGSFLPTKRGNQWLGRVMALIVYTPFSAWRHDHAIHHATAGDLDRRGGGDVPTLTVDEYLAMSWGGRLGYRLFRNPWVMFTIGPFYALVIQPRLVPKDARPRIKRSIHLTNVVLALAIAGLCLLMGPVQFLLVQAPLVLLAGGAGVWLFYVQHQFEDVYWECGENWSYADAALQGSSYLKLPQPLQFFTGNIGLHHVHHLSARIPNYNLQRAHEENAIFHGVPVLSIADGFRATRLKLWCRERRRLVTFAEARVAAAPAA
ncbi:fatty acid desaturase [Patulibacter defluvii]|uniref:fatty acid desaturase n=1 Tax=Patulibacter defluvii TaxID=3095358 RepID=UPI002A75C0DB|nr:fatty acid desaturase [Patulibacter sp. DM4]